MLKLYDPETAQRTILRRELAEDVPYPPALQSSIEHIFGPGTNPPQVVDQILTSVRRKETAPCCTGQERLTMPTCKISGFRQANFKQPLTRSPPP